MPSTEASQLDRLINFPVEMPGLEGCKQFLFYHQEHSQSPVVYWLKSVENPDVMLSLIMPHMAGVDYHFKLSDEEMTLLQAEKSDDVLVLLPLYKTEKAIENLSNNTVGNTAINATLHAPILINPDARLGMQKILHKAEITALIKEID